jgi:hypothetical protein
MPASLKQTFIDIVASVPPEHFRTGDADLIEMYASAIALSRRAYAELDRHGPVVNNKASPWIVTLEKAHRSAVALTARLRLAPQMRIDRKTAGRKIGPPPSYYDVMRQERDDDGAA